uniref:Reverse transcriptase domain-containing protein n=1 Tax=Tanacetum cinerariifolium TaxID=118510 RepID=A0A699IYC0_TANCI|nr:reverse transcriptase domain-containing protein [Tanacetum cinerariifolium]
MILNIDSAMKHSYSNDDIRFSIDVIDEILKEDFDALLNEESKILHSIKGIFLEEEIVSIFDEFMAMTADENSESESDTEESPFKKITINTDYKIKTSIEEPPTDLKLKPDNLEYVFLEEPSFLPAADRVVTPTPGSAITIPKIENEFSIKDTKNEAVRLMMFPLSLTGEAKTWLDELNEGTIETWNELRTAFISRFFPLALFDRLLGEICTFSQHENESLTDAWLRMKEML